MRLRTVGAAALAALSVLLVACGESASPTLTAGPATATATLPATPTATPTPPPAAEQPAPALSRAPAAPPATPTPTIPEASDLLASANAAMAEVDSVQIVGQTLVKESKESEFELIVAQFQIDGHPAGDNRLRYTLQANNPAINFTLTLNSIDIGEVSYFEDPFTGEWEAEPREPSEGDPLVELMEGRLRLESMAVSFESFDDEPTYMIVGNHPREDAGTGRQVTLWIGTDNSLLRRMDIEETVSTDEYEGLIPSDLQELFENSVIRLSRLNEPVEIVSPILQPPPLPIALSLGPSGLSSYASAEYPFSIQYPADWRAVPPAPSLLPQCVLATACFVGETGGTFAITEEDLGALGLGTMTLTEYVDFLLAVLQEADPSAEVESRQATIMPQGFSVELLAVTLNSGRLKASRLVYLHEGKVGFNATHIAPQTTYDGLVDVINQSLSTFRLDEEQN